jgi:hypothetical protein
MQYDFDAAAKRARKNLQKEDRHLGDKRATDRKDGTL